MLKKFFLIFSTFCVLQLLENALLNLFSTLSTVWKTFSTLLEGVFHTVDVFSTLFTVVIYSLETEFT